MSKLLVKWHWNLDHGRRNIHLQVQANMESHQAESNRRGMNLKYWFMKMEHIYTSATKHGTISSWKHCMPYMFKVILTNHRLNMSRTYKNNTEASRVEQIFGDKRSYVIKALQIKPDIGATHKRYLPFWSVSSEDHKNLLFGCTFVDCFCLFWWL